MKYDFFTKEYQATELVEKWDDDKRCYRMMTHNESHENHYEEKRTARNKIAYINKKIQEYRGIECERFRVRMLREDLAIWEKYQKDAESAGPRECVFREGTPHFVW